MPWTTATEIARNQRPSRSAPIASWSSPAAQHEHAEHAEAVRLHGLVDEHGQPGGRAAHLEAAAGQEPGDQTAHDAGDQAEFGRDAGRDGDAHAQGQGDEEDDEGRGDIGPQGGADLEFRSHGSPPVPPHRMARRARRGEFSSLHGEGSGRVGTRTACPEAVRNPLPVRAAGDQQRNV